MRNLVLVTALLAASAAPAYAGDSLGRIVPPEDGARACFKRVYDAAHLAKHPDQKVEEIGFRMAYAGPETEAGPDGRHYAFRLEARRRGEGRSISTGGECRETDGRIFCFVECDGGGIYLSPRAGRSILLSFGDSEGIRMEGCGETDEALLPGRDDKSFRLDRLPASQCPAYAHWWPDANP